ncbi:DsrE/DsrF/TusD sulfur relay family protein [Escherichia coli]
MQKIVIVANGAPYGSESLFNSLRLAIALREQESNLDLRLFLMSMRSQPGCAGKKPVEGYNIQQMLEILTAQNVPVKLCKTCTDGRGISTLPLIDGWKSVLLWNWRNGRCQPIKCSHFNV